MVTHVRCKFQIRLATCTHLSSLFYTNTILHCIFHYAPFFVPFSLKGQNISCVSAFEHSYNMTICYFSKDMKTILTVDIIEPQSLNLINLSCLTMFSDKKES